MDIRTSFSHQNRRANGQFHSVHFDEMADAGHLHRGISMPEINTEFLFTIALEIQVSSLGDTPYGSRRIFHFDGGSFEGPKLKGTVPPGGGSSLIRRDDVLEVDVRLILETDDKHQIYGLRHGPKEVMDRLYRGEIVDPRAYYLRLRKVRLDEPHLCDCDRLAWGERTNARCFSSVEAVMSAFGT